MAIFGIYFKYLGCIAPENGCNWKINFVFGIRPILKRCKLAVQTSGSQGSIALVGQFFSSNFVGKVKGGGIFFPIWTVRNPFDFLSFIPFWRSSKKSCLTLLHCLPQKKSKGAFYPSNLIIRRVPPFCFIGVPQVVNPCARCDQGNP